MCVGGEGASSDFCPCGKATSAATVVILAPVALPISAAAVSSVLASRPFITTSQPASARARAVALLSPRLDAQTMALRPAIPRSIGAPRGGDVFASSECQARSFGGQPLPLRCRTRLLSLTDRITFDD